MMEELEGRWSRVDGGSGSVTFATELNTTRMHGNSGVTCVSRVGVTFVAGAGRLSLGPTRERVLRGGPG